MKTIKNLERLRQIHSLIECERTGSPCESANKMHISERLVYGLIGQLKDLKADISYDRGRKTYYYRDDFKLQVSISVSVISNNEVTDIFGGSYFVHDSMFAANFLVKNT